MLQLITGSMYSGKSEYIIKKVIDLRSKGVSVACFKPSLDTRDKKFIKSRALKETIEARYISTDSFKKPFFLTEDEALADVIVIDEIQFVDVNIINYLITQWLTEDKTLILAGLEEDFLGNEFASVKFVKMFKPVVFRFKANCFMCGTPSICKSRRVHDNKIVLEGNQVAIEGKKFEYIALCGKCDDKKLKEVGKCC